MSVYVAVPNLGWIHRDGVEVLLRLSREEQVSTITMPVDRPVDSNRNKIIKNFLETDCTHLLMFDADNPPMRNPLDLLAYDKDVMILPTPVYVAGEDPPIYWNCLDEAEGGWKEHVPQEGLQRIAAGGAGCMLIKREVLETVKVPFRRAWNGEGVAVIGSDYLFCEQVRDHGFEVWCHYDYPCRHFKEIDLASVSLALGQAKESINGED